jgi:hypothetical protein
MIEKSNEKSELNYRKIIEFEINNLGLKGETREKLLAESDEILKYALESKDHNDFISKLVWGVPKFDLVDFKYDHVIDFLVKRARLSKQSALADFRSRVGKTFDSTHSVEQRNTTHGSMMAIQAFPLEGKSTFAVQDLATDVAANPEEVKTWVEAKTKSLAEARDKSGLGFFFFLFQDGKWKLVAMDTDVEPYKRQIETFFSQNLLGDLWKSHRPSAHKDSHEFNTARKTGGLN